MKNFIDADYPCDGVAVLTLRGELDVSTSPYLKQQVVSLIERRVTRLVIDLSSADYLDSTALGVLIGTLKRVTECGGELRLVCQNTRNRRIFDITGLARIFDFYDSPAQALEQFCPDRVKAT